MGSILRLSLKEEAQLIFDRNDRPRVCFAVSQELVAWQIDLLPHILGALMAFAGLGWLTFLSPPVANHLSPCLFAPGTVGEGALTLCLLVIGVNAQRWKEQASAAV